MKSRRRVVGGTHAWLGDRYEARRQAATLVLTELAVNAPTLMFTYVPQILDNIWTVLRDPKVCIVLV